MGTTLGNPTSLAQATEQPLRYGYTIGSGPFTIRSHKGTRAQVEARIPEYLSQGFSYEVIQGEGNVWTIEGRAQIDGSGGAGSGFEVADKWELQPNKVAKDLLSSNSALVAGLTATNIRAIRHALANDTPDGAAPSGLTGDALTVYTYMKAGFDQWTVHQPIMRHAISIPRNWSFAVNAGNIGKILTTTQLYTLEGLPNDFLFGLPAIVAQLAAATRTDGISLITGWYKGFPTVEVTNQGRRDASIDYEFGLWPAAGYSAA